MPQRNPWPVTLTCVLMLATVVPQQASSPQQPAGPPPGPRPPQPVQTVTRSHIPPEMFAVPEGLEVTVWATSPLLFNPVNMDIDRDGRSGWPKA